MGFHTLIVLYKIHNRTSSLNRTIKDDPWDHCVYRVLGEFIVQELETSVIETIRTIVLVRVRCEQNQSEFDFQSVVTERLVHILNEY